MQKKYMVAIIIIFTSILIIDFYTFKGINILISTFNFPINKKLLLIIHWLITLIIISGFTIAIIKSNSNKLSTNDYLFFYYLFGIFLLFYIPKLQFLIFHIIEDIINVFIYLIKNIIKNENITIKETLFRTSRIVVISKIGIIAATIPFVLIFYGMTIGKYNFHVKKETLFFPNLPKSFNGLKIVHISDIHIGTFHNKKQVKKAIDMINEQNADIIFFTGDMVNNYAEEIIGWENILGAMKAKIGKYSILGNHDYGDYVNWNNEKEKEENKEKLISKHKEIGFYVLLDQSKKVYINGEYIEIIGVENWGIHHFHQYGDLKAAMQNVDSSSFKILLSHDPSHWDEEVISKTDIELTLSGHTHGLQIGIDSWGIKWSPVKWLYPRWSGLYKENEQYLYINQGFGHIGYPGRIGISPEITVIELHAKN
ncbi:MAG: metallophosphoesterase [Bacteroidales bacterium]|nr:metallophosphoesterase [Bacteroidales bacterium]